MNSVDPKSLIHGIKISSVVPAMVTVEPTTHDLSNMDLAMKLHYLRTVYYYKKEAIKGLDIYAFKKSMFKCLDIYFAVAGRIRRSQSGRPFIKCNDSGVRIVEAQCSMALDEWLEMKDQSLHKQLVSNNVLGPELLFSPSVFLQFTKFKCGGLALGFSWAHVLGGPVIASKFINMWSQLLSGVSPPQSIHLPIKTDAGKPDKTFHVAAKPLSTRRVQPVGDHWLNTNNRKMELHSFHVTDTQLKHLRSKISGQTTPFEAVSALIWQCLAKTREEGIKIVTVCQNSYRNEVLLGVMSNDQMIISSIEADFYVAEAELTKLAMLIRGGKKDESKEIEAMLDNDNGSPDLIIYGANLTFVDLEEVDLYALELKGQKPASIYYAIDSIGDEGVVLVLQEHPNGATTAGGAGEDGGRTVTVIIPENEVWHLRDALKRDWCIS